MVLGFQRPSLRRVKSDKVVFGVVGKDRTHMLILAQLQVVSHVACLPVETNEIIRLSNLFGEIYLVLSKS